MQKYHLISVAEPLIFDLALDLKRKGFEVSVSGVDISDPIRTTLQAASCVFYGDGWYPEHLSKDIFTVILGSLVKQDNPELLKAKQMGLMIRSIPEFIFQCTKAKTRVVIAGSCGKDKILSMIVYTLQKQKLRFDYALSNKLTLLPNYVSLDYEPRIVLIEGDEYITLALDKKYQLEFYRPQIAVITTLKWTDPVRYTSSTEYLATYHAFVASIEREGKFIYFEEDRNLIDLAAKVREDVTSIPFNVHEIWEKEGQTYLKTRHGDFPIAIGDDDYFLVNVNAARLVCRQLGVKDSDFYHAVSDYSLSLQA